MSRGRSVRGVFRARVDQTAHAIGKEHVNLLRLDDGCDFAEAVDRMQDGLSGAVGARAVVGCPGLRLRARASRLRLALKGAARPALRAVHARNLTAFGDGRDDVAALLFADGAEFLDPITHLVQM